MSIAIVAVGYNRPDSMQQLLKSIEEAHYENDSVDLVVSIDKGNNQKEIVAVAEKVKWPYGEKVIRAFPERQGLRNHILQCGDLTEKYDAVVVLEDDLLVSKAYYKFVRSAIEYYGQEDCVAGISLYAYSANEFSFTPFIPAFNGYDTYLLQVAQSWGQCWTKKMWERFRAWEYADAAELPLGEYMPKRIFNWGKTSWKKNYMAYLALNNLFFVYPYHSYSTNRSERGEHRNNTSNDFQVALVEQCSEWRFAPVDRAVRYDVFYDRIGIEERLKYGDKRVCLDMYGLKNDFSGFDILISAKERPYHVIEEIGLVYRPIEQNCITREKGRGLYIYDLHKCSVSKRMKRNDNYRSSFDYICLTYRRSLKYGLYGVKKYVVRFFSKLQWR